MSRKRDPKTREEWQEAATAADWVLAIDSCIQYGLIEVEGEWKPNVERCYWVLEEARKRSIEPASINFGGDAPTSGVKDGSENKG